MTKKVLLIAFFLCIIPLRTLQAENTEIIQTDQMSVLFEKPLRIAAKDIALMYPTLKTELENTLEWSIEFKPTIVLVIDSEKFREMTGNSLIVAYAVSRRNLIVIDYSKMNTKPFSLGPIIKHELCHLLLHDKITKVMLPRWLDEGVSQWASDGIAEIIMSRKGSILDSAVLSNRLLSLRRLDKRFPRDEKSLLLAYEESKSLVEFITQEFGRAGLLDLLKRMEDGDEVDVAILKSLSISQDELQKRWQTHLKNSITWFTYLANNLYGILFFLAALITVAGFVRVVIK
ncbi:MAG: peptidase MA family metallohydrolase, partial [Syntrophobacterales bacterium]